MQGPFPAGQHAAPFSTWEDIVGIRRGERYQVIKAFKDSDGDLHEVGESWIFLMSGFSGHLNEKCFVIRSPDSPEEWRIRLTYFDDQQKDVSDNLWDYFRLHTMA